MFILISTNYLDRDEAWNLADNLAYEHHIYDVEVHRNPYGWFCIEAETDMWESDTEFAAFEHQVTSYFHVTGFQTNYGEDRQYYGDDDEDEDWSDYDNYGYDDLDNENPWGD